MLIVVSKKVPTNLNLLPCSSLHDYVILIFVQPLLIQSHISLFTIQLTAAAS